VESARGGGGNTYAQDNRRLCTWLCNGTAWSVMTALIMTFAGIAWVGAALSAVCCYSAYKMASQIRSLRSLQGEIAEIDDCVVRLIKTIQRMEGRQTAMLRKDSPETKVTTSEPEATLMDKAALRRYVGLIPGQPAKHNNG